MSTHNIGFHKEISKIISSNMQLISSSDYAGPSLLSLMAF